MDGVGFALIALTLIADCHVFEGGNVKRHREAIDGHQYRVTVMINKKTPFPDRPFHWNLVGALRSTRPNDKHQRPLAAHFILSIHIHLQNAKPHLI